MAKEPEAFLPLSQATYYILLSLREVRHGYGIMQDVEEVSVGEVILGPGTLYGALSKLEKQKVIEKAKVQDDDRRKYYQLTNLGREILQLEFRRLKSLVENSREMIKEMERK
jgi:DNA-binding PadR family transcriptional regulator